MQPADQSGEVEGVVGISRERWDEERKEEEKGGHCGECKQPTLTKVVEAAF